MEQRLDRALLSVQRLTAELDEYVKVQEDILALEAYYGSNEWKQDFADDERQRAGDENQKVPATEKDAQTPETDLQTPETDLQSTETAVQWPKDLKRGVLSEDAIWNLLEDCHDLNERMNEITTTLKVVSTGKK